MRRDGCAPERDRGRKVLGQKAQPEMAVQVHTAGEAVKPGRDQDKQGGSGLDNPAICSPLAR